MSKIKRFINYSKQNGLRSALEITIRILYGSYLRWLFPYKIGVYNGVIIRDCPPNNPFSPSHSLKHHIFGIWSNIIQSRPFVYKDYEEPLISSLKKNVKPRDDVLIIGGGRGGTTVVAARQVGEKGSIITYEAAKEKIDICKETTHFNNVNDICDIKGSIVGEKKNVSGEPVDKNITPVKSLPECDVLEMDCEGAEIHILKKLKIRPRVIIVETHGATDPLNNEVAGLLNSLDYEIIGTGVENSDSGCYILTAIRDE